MGFGRSPCSRRKPATRGGGRLAASVKYMLEHNENYGEVRPVRWLETLRRRWAAQRWWGTPEYRGVLQAWGDVLECMRDEARVRRVSASGLRPASRVVTAHRRPVELGGLPMKASVIVVVSALMASAAATAAAALAPPPIASQTPFRTARAELAKEGFVPARLVSTREGCGAAACRALRPVSCYRSLGVCRWLFVDRASNALYFVDVSAEEGRDGSIGVQPFQRIWLAEREELEWQRIEVVLPNGVHRRFVPPPPEPPPPERSTPLCSEVPPHTLPCWVKPPADYRARR